MNANSAVLFIARSGGSVEPPAVNTHLASLSATLG